MSRSYTERAAARAAASSGEVEVDHALIPVVSGRGNVHAVLAESSARWFAVPDGGEVAEVVIASADAVFYESHFTRRRHVPCLGSGRCRLCPALGRSPRWAVVVHVPGERRPWLWDFSGYVMEQVERIQGEVGAPELTGLRLEVSRLGRARNTPIVVSLPSGSPFDDEAVLGGLSVDETAQLVQRALASALRAVGA